MLACLLLALSFGTIAALQLVAMNYLHNLDPMHSPYDMDQRPYRGGEIAVGGMVWSLGASVAATVMWAVGRRPSQMDMPSRFAPSFCSTSLFLPIAGLLLGSYQLEVLQAALIQTREKSCLHWL